MLEGKSYHAIDMVSPIVYGFIDQVTGCTQSAKMTRVRAIYSSMMSRSMLRNWRGRSTSEELKAFGSEVCAFKKRVSGTVSFCLHIRSIYDDVSLAGLLRGGRQKI